VTTPQRTVDATHRVERAISVIAIAIAVLSLACLVVVLASPVLGVPAASLAEPGYRAVFLTGYFGLPLAFLLLIALVVMRIRSDRRARRDRG